MTQTLDDRRAALRAAVKETGPSDVEPFRLAIAGATEEERAALARTLPPGKLYKTEDGSLRGCFVLTALGSSKAIDRAFGDRFLLKPSAEMTAALIDGTRERPLSLVDAVITDAYAHFHSDFARDLVESAHSERGLPRPESGPYLRHFAYRAGARVGRNPETQAEEFADVLLSDPAYLDHDLWAMFRAEGTNYLLEDRRDTRWVDAFGLLEQRVDGFRERLLDESLAGQLRDFSARNIVEYHRIHRALNPADDEVLARQATYRALLGAAPSASVGLGQEMLARVIDAPALDRAAVVDASPSVFLRSEKKTRKVHLQLLGAVIAAEPALAQQVSGVVAEALPGLPPDLQKSARALTADAAVSPQAPLPTGPGAAVAPPRTTALPVEASTLAPVDSDAELFQLIADLAEGYDDQGGLIRLMRHVAANPRPTAVPEALHQHLRKQFRSFAENWPGETADQRWRGLVLDWFGDDMRDAPGHHAQLWSRDTAAVVAVFDGRAVQQWGVLHDDQRAPDAYALLMRQLNSARSGAPVIDEPVAHRTGTWRREVPPAARYSSGPWPSWIDDAAPPPSPSTPVTELAYRIQYTGHLRIAAASWAIWVYRENPDRLAAHIHGQLQDLSEGRTAPGTDLILDAVGSSHFPPDRPVYSALALAMSAEAAEYRLYAAEAVAGLCENNLLDPDAFAAEIVVNLSEGFVKAGRLAQAMTDSASISPAAGYRVTQTLAALLPQLPSVTGAVKLVELLAQLTADYGVAVAVPEHLQAKTKGSSVMAIALRHLADSTDHDTPLRARAAAALSTDPA